MSSLLANDNQIDLNASDLLYSQEEYEAALFRSSFKRTSTNIEPMSLYCPKFILSIDPTLVGNKVLLDPSVLKDIASKGEIPTPMTFEIYNLSNHMKGYCGVLEFSAPKGTIVFPKEIAQQLFAQEGSYMQIRLVDLPKAQLIKFQVCSFMK